MIRTIIKSATVSAAIILLAGGLSGGIALAQGAAVDATNSPSQNQSTNGPAGTYGMTTTQKNIAPDGTETDATQRFDKSQSYTSGNGALSAHTHIETTGPAHIETTTGSTTNTTTNTTTTTTR